MNQKKEKNLKSLGKGIVLCLIKLNETMVIHKKSLHLPFLLVFSSGFLWLKNDCCFSQVNKIQYTVAAVDDGWWMMMMKTKLYQISNLWFEYERKQWE